MKHFNIPETDALRDVYNKHYSEKVDYWSIHDLKTTSAIVHRILKGFNRLSISFPVEPRLLDVGCAKGHFAEAWRQNVFSVTGTDISDVAIALAARNFPSINFFVSDGMNPDTATQYDVIFIRHFSGFSTHTMNHVFRLMNDYYNMLSNSGILLIAVSTDLSGNEKENEMVNWDADELARIRKAIPGFTTILYPEESRYQRLLKEVVRMISDNRKYKRCYYLIFRKDH